MFWKQRSAAGSRATWGGAKGEHRARDEEVAWDIQESRPWRPGNQQVGRDPWRPCCHEHELRSPGGDLSSKGHFCRQDFSIDDLAHYTRVHTHAHMCTYTHTDAHTCAHVHTWLCWMTGHFALSRTSWQH